MGYFYQESIDEHTKVAIWKIEEDDEFYLSKLSLFENEQAKLERINVPHKKTEWLASRYLLKLLVADAQPIKLIKTAEGKPKIEGKDLEISLSHSHNYVAAMVGKTPLGIDIEEIHPKIFRIQHKFLRPEELEAIDKKNALSHTYQIWSAKEALYKFYGLGRLRFKEQIWVTPFSYKQFNVTKGRVVKDDFDEQCQIYIKQFGNLVAVWAI